MKGKIVVALLALSLSLSAPAAVKLANGDQLGPALDDVRISMSDNMNRALEVAQRRLGLTLAESQALVKAIQNGQSFTSVGDVDAAIVAFGGGSSDNGNGGNGNGGNGNGGGESGENHVNKSDYAVDKAAQTVLDQGQDEHINAVQGAAQTANDRATALEGRADNTEGAVRETNAQVAVTDARSISNAGRLDGVEAVNADQDKHISGNAHAIATETDQRKAADVLLGDRITTAQGTADYANARVDAANANIEANRQALVNTNKRVAQNSADITNHEQRIQKLESDNNRKFGDLNRQIDENKKRADAGTAGVAAMANIPQVTESARFSVGAGIGARGDEQAVAVGFSSRLSQNVVGKLSVASDTQSGWTAGAGIAVQW